LAITQPVSASQISTFKNCPRRWAYTYLDKIKLPPSSAAKFGSSVHHTLEKYLLTNTIDYEIREGQVAKPGLHYLPKGLNSDQVEKYFEFNHKKIGFRGYIDFFNQDSTNNVLVGDHKTCSSFRTALTSEQLKHNVQSNIYAQWAFQELGAESVKLKWIYYRTKGKPAAQCVEAEIKKHEQPSLFETHLGIASSIIDTLNQKPDSLDMPKNLNSCFKYGRCPFWDACKANRKPLEMRNENKMPIVEKETLPTKNSFHLYIDCTPTKLFSPYEKTIELSDLIKPVLQKIQSEKELSHYRLAGYGQHVGLIANFLGEYLKQQNFDHRTAVLSSIRTPEGCDTLQTLSAAAGQVVRGF
jgi:hypothetical protein